MKELKVTNMRWPGGNFLMGYDWQDGIGPKEQRPTRINLTWGGVDNNHVGTDEWMKLIKSMGSENIVCVNPGLSTIMDAAYWVEYCNYKGGTYYSDLRAKNGHKEPYNVRIWDLGNEVDGLPWELGHKNAEDYIETAREAAKAMKVVDSTIKLVACGSSWYSQGTRDDWNRKILTGLRDRVDYISIHSYWENSANYYNYMGTVKEFKNPVTISVDEYGAFGRSFLNVLPVAQSLNSFIRHADVVKMANFTTMTSLLPSEPNKGTFKSPSFYTFKLFSNNCRGNSVDTYVQCDTFNTEKYKGTPFLDVTSVYSKETNAVFINVVNRHQDKAITAEITSTSGDFAGKAEAGIITSDDSSAPFVFDKQSQYLPVTREGKLNNNKLSFTFPPHSLRKIKVPIKKN